MTIYAVKVDDTGTKRWYVDDKVHRTDGPACEYADGSKCWYHDGKLHRVDGPAVEYASGTKCWYVDNKLHRVDGPAVEWGDGGSKSWWLDGKHLTQAQWLEAGCKAQSC